MTAKGLSDELERIIKYLCEVANKQDKYALEIVDEVKQNLEALEILKHYAVNNGWSNGWVIKFWEMSSKELKKVNEVLKKDKLIGDIKDFEVGITPLKASVPCEGCPIYEDIKKGKTIVNDACSFCSKSPTKVGD